MSSLIFTKVIKLTPGMSYLYAQTSSNFEQIDGICLVVEKQKPPPKSFTAIGFALPASNWFVYQCGNPSC